MKNFLSFSRKRFDVLVNAKLLSLLFLIFLFSTAYTQFPEWDTISMDPSVMFSDICVLPDGQHGWVVGTTGAGGEILTSIVGMTDGENWEQIPFPGSNSVTLGGVYFISPDSGWVVGYSGVIFATTDGGQSWFQQVSGTSRKLAKVHFIDNMTGWITGGWQDGSSFLILKTTDGGNTWQDLSFGSDCYSCLDIYFSDDMNGWICGHDSQLDPHIHHTEDGGLTWTSQVVPVGAGTTYSIEFADENNGWATTSSLYLTPTGAILHTTDGGDTWEIQTYTGLHYNYCLDVKDAQHIALASVQILSPVSQKIFVSSDGGQNWNSYTPPVINYTQGIQYVNDDIWFASDFGQILHSNDNGVSWDWDYKASLYKSIAWSNQMKGWVTAGSHAGYDGYCVRTDDGGETWYYDENVPGGSQVDFINENTGWMLLEGNSPKIWRTTDGGENWNQFSIGSGGAWIGNFFFISESKGWAFGSNGAIRATSDGGITWSNQNSGTSNYVAAVFFVDENEGWAAGGYGGANGFIRHTTDGGATWTAQTPANSDHIQVAYFADNQTGILVGVNGRVHKTTDGGQSWSIVAQVNHDYADKLIMDADNTGYLSMRNHYASGAGEDGRGFIYKTENGGESWNLEWTGPWPKSSISGLAFQFPGKLWACGAHNTIIERISGTTGFREVTVSPSNLIISPNPFTYDVKISYQIDKFEKVKVQLFDISGQLITTFVNEKKNEGKYEVYWNGKDELRASLPDGLYFCTLQTGSKVWTKKIVKVK